MQVCVEVHSKADLLRIARTHTHIYIYIYIHIYMHMCIHIYDTYNVL